MAEKFCVDCASSYVNPNWPGFLECSRNVIQEAPAIDLVTGEPYKVRGLDNLSCDKERKSIWPWACGKFGKFFRRKG